LKFKAPYPSYFVFLHERYFLFQFRALSTCNPYNITSTNEFLEVYYGSSKKDMNLICELYQHNIVLYINPEWNQIHFRGDIQVRVFT
jgi:hypothetical protein